MALFTDGTISNIEDLAAHDSALLDVAGTEGIDLTRKLSLAQEEVGVELTTFLPLSDAGSPSLENIVVTTPLRLWHTFQTLALLYRDAYNSQLNDRYQGKWMQYRELAKWAAEKLMMAGVGIVSDPVPQAQAPELVAAPGLQPAATYYASVCWVNASGEEGAASLAASLTTTDGNTLVVGPVNVPANATRWNVFVGFSADGLSLQNATPLLLNQTWTYATPALAEGRRPGNGQLPNYRRSLPRLLQRG